MVSLPRRESAFLPPFDQYRITLRLHRATQFPREHGGVIRGALSRALETHQLPAGLVPFACQSGRRWLDVDDRYTLKVTLFGEDRASAESLQKGLARLGGTQARAPRPVLGGNFVVESFAAIEPPPDPDTVADRLRRSEETDLVFESPFRMKRPEEDRRPGAGFFDHQFFPAPRFLDRLWRRLFFLREGRYPCAVERGALPPFGSQLKAEPEELRWSDVTIRGAPNKGRSYSLGGVRGRLELRGLSDDWLPIVAAGTVAHVGQGLHYGLGRYSLPTTSSRSWRDFS